MTPQADENPADVVDAAFSKVAAFEAVVGARQEPAGRPLQLVIERGAVGHLKRQASAGRHHAGQVIERFRDLRDVDDHSPAEDMIEEETPLMEEVIEEKSLVEEVVEKTLPVKEVKEA